MSQALIDAYLAYRGATHQLALQQQPVEVDADRFTLQREQVVGQWERLLGAPELMSDASE